MGKINTDNYPNRPVSSYQDDDMFILQDNGGETYTTNVGDIKTLIDNKISGKADKVSSATAGHLAGLDANGNLTDSGISVSNGTINATELVTSDGVTANDISYFNDIDLDGSSIYGVGTLNVNQVDVHDGQAVEFLTDITVNGAVADEDGNVLSNKADKVTNATSGHLAGLDSNGNLTDSGVSPTEEVTVEGNPITFDSPFEQDAKSVVVSVKPIQAGSGTPSPENIRPISGIDELKIPVTGKNLLPCTAQTKEQNGVTWTVNADKSITPSGTPTANSIIEIGTAPVNAGMGNVRLSGLADTQNVSWNQLLLRMKDGSERDISPGLSMDDQIINLSEYPNVVGLVVEIKRRQNNTPCSGTARVMLELGTTASAYEPYTGHTTTIPLPSTLYDADVDVTNGGGDSTHELKAISASDDIVFAVLHSGCDLFKLNGVSYKAEGNIISNMFKGDIDFAGAYSAYINSTGNVIFAVPTGLYNASQFKAFLVEQGCTICCELATPTTISFDPADVELLEGTNVVSTNGEKVAVTYGRSLWQDIDDLKSDTEGKLDKSDVADVEGDTASKAYSVNDFMLRADGLYKVTQPIASGASITASNTTKTTVGEVLTALLNA